MNSGQIESIEYSIINFMTFGSLCVHLMILFQRGKKFQCYLIKNDKLVKILHTARNLTGPGLFVIKKSHVLLVDTII